MPLRGPSTPTCAQVIRRKGASGVGSAGPVYCKYVCLILTSAADIHLLRRCCCTALWGKSWYASRAQVCVMNAGLATLHNINGLDFAQGSCFLGPICMPAPPLWCSGRRPLPWCPKCRRAMILRATHTLLSTPSTWRCLPGR